MKKNQSESSLVLCELGDPGFDRLETYSPFCLKVHRALRAGGFAYKRRHATSLAEYKDLNPVQQVPILLIDDEAVYDSTVILDRLDALGAGLLPDEPRVRAEAQLYEELADTLINGFVVAARWADDRNWPKAREAFFAEVPAPAREQVSSQFRELVVGALIGRDVWRAGADRCWALYERTLGNLERRAPESGYWMGDGITVADVALFGQLHSLRLPMTEWQADVLSRHEKLSLYLDRVHEATAFRRHVRAAS